MAEVIPQQATQALNLMCRVFLSITSCTAALLLTTVAAHAQDISLGPRINGDGALLIDDLDPDGQSVKLGETDLVPSLRIDFLSTDNTFRTADNEIDSTTVVVSPQVNWYAERRLIDLRASYQGSFAQSSEDAPDYADHLLGFSANVEFNSKNRSFASIAFSSEHDDIGSGVLSNITESDPLDVAETSNFRLSAAHTFGARSARGNLTGGLRVESRNFRNQPTFTAGRDHLRIEPFARFSYRASADTRFIIGGRLANFTFDNDINDRLDGTLFAGVNFAATGKLSGIFRIGATQSSFSESERSDETSLFLDADLLYRPSDFSQLRLGLRRDVDNDRGSFTALESALDTTLTASWDHQWSSRISTRAAIEVEDFDATCPEPSDTVTTPSFELEFALRRWISFGLSASAEQRDVSDCDNTAIDDQGLDEYDRQDFGVFVRGSL